MIFLCYWTCSVFLWSSLKPATSWLLEKITVMVLINRAELIKKKTTTKNLLRLLTKTWFAFRRVFTLLHTAQLQWRRGRWQHNWEAVVGVCMFAVLSLWGPLSLMWALLTYQLTIHFHPNFPPCPIITDFLNIFNYLFCFPLHRFTMKWKKFMSSWWAIITKRGREIFYQEVGKGRANRSVTLAFMSHTKPMQFLMCPPTVNLNLVGEISQRNLIYMMRFNLPCHKQYHS